MDEDINEHVDENKTPNLREPDENSFARGFGFSTSELATELLLRSCLYLQRATSRLQIL